MLFFDDIGVGRRTICVYSGAAVNIVIIIITIAGWVLL